ncbi:hypothetical protein ABT404_18090 [Streptomyces hyaluromycini]|uniref:SHOCT domain-containing protein n=1 Tax=Streptomyces hyaluromycini TaxID=1377993 RepID=A0ABV1WX85_9ACTN
MTGNGWMTGWMWAWPVFVVAGLLLVGFVVVRPAQGGTHGRAAPRPVGSAARRILDERQARREIDEDEYPLRRSVLP